MTPMAKSNPASGRSAHGLTCLHTVESTQSVYYAGPIPAMTAVGGFGRPLARPCPTTLDRYRSRICSGWRISEITAPKWTNPKCISEPGY